MFYIYILHYFTIIVGFLTLLLFPYVFKLSPEFALSSFVPVMIYYNLETDKSQILSDNKGKTGIYMWTHLEIGRIYIGSAFELFIRLNKYFTPSQLKKTDNYTCRALLYHIHLAFSLAILEYIDINNLSKEEARKLILSREQYYLGLIFREMNLILIIYLR